MYLTGRSTRAGGTTEGLPGTVEETAEEVTRGGGTGIAVRCDHTRDEDVAAPFERVRSEGGRLDLLVNNAWGGYEEHQGARFVAFGMAGELRRHRVASVALAPGFMRTERVLAAHARDRFDLGPTESPAYVARAVVSLAADPDVLARSGELLTAG